MANDEEIVPERKLPATSDCPLTVSAVTRSPVRQVIPFQEQQAVPFFHELRMPEGSLVIPDLKARRPASSSG